MDRAHSTVVGIFHYGSRGNYVTPIDQKITQEIVIPPGMEYPEATGQLGGDARSRGGVSPSQIRRSRPGRGGRSPHRLDDLEGVVVDVEITDWPQPRKIRAAESSRFSAAKTTSASTSKSSSANFTSRIVSRRQSRRSASIPANDSRPRTPQRRDFRDLAIVTIDGETARDFDDAVLVRMLPNDNFELQVHIADVAQYVTPDSALDQEARLRGTSVYFPDRAVPMLPLELSTDICSLRPQVDRLVLSCIMEIDHRGEIVGYELCEGVIRSAERMTYTDVNAVLEGDEAHAQALRATGRRLRTHARSGA